MTFFAPTRKQSTRPGGCVYLNTGSEFARDLSGWWPLGAYPDARDLSLFGNHGLPNNSPPPGGSGDRFGWNLNGTDHYATVNDSDSLDLGSNFTIAAWINRSSSIGSYPFIVSKFTGGSDRYELFLDNTSYEIAVAINSASYNT